MQFREASAPPPSHSAIGRSGLEGYDGRENGGVVMKRTNQEPFPQVLSVLREENSEEQKKLF